MASPLLANIYMNRFLKHWRQTARSEAFRAHVVSCADDFVILSRGRADEALAWTKTVMTRLGLTLNEAKTSVRNARQEPFGPEHFRKETMSTSAFGTSSRGGTKWQGAARAASPKPMSSAMAVCCVYVASTSGRRRQLCGEASRKAGCRKSARPV